MKYNSKIKLTVEEVEALKRAMEKGGQFLEIHEKPFRLATILEPDGNGGWKVMMTVSKDLTLKLQNFYSDPIPAGFHMVDLKWFIEKYC